jgi:hypothetical protein
MGFFPLLKSLPPLLGSDGGHRSESNIMMATGFLRSIILIIVVSVLGFSSSFASGKDETGHSGKITKSKAERIALAKMPGGKVRSAELETAKGQQFWSVYIGKPGSKNAKEIRVDAATGKILAVQTERPEDQAEEPAKSH